MVPTSTTAATALVALRGALAAGWVAPVRSAGLFGLADAGQEPSLPYLFRLFAVRDGGLAYLTARSSGAARRQVLTVGVAIDLADAVAGVLAGASGRTPRRAAISATATALAAAALGAVALSGD